MHKSESLKYLIIKIILMVTVHSKTLKNFKIVEKDPNIILYRNKY